MNLELKSKVITQPYKLLSNNFLSCYFLLPAQIRGDTGHTNWLSKMYFYSGRIDVLRFVHKNKWRTAKPITDVFLNRRTNTKNWNKSVLNYTEKDSHSIRIPSEQDYVPHNWKPLTYTEDEKMEESVKANVHLSKVYWHGRKYLFKNYDDYSKVFFYIKCLA